MNLYGKSLKMGSVNKKDETGKKGEKGEQEMKPQTGKKEANLEIRFRKRVG